MQHDDSTDSEIITRDVHSDYDERDAEFWELRRRCNRFRILIMGKANAGKTTILQKLCQSTELPVVHDHDGKKIDPTLLGDASRERGIHDIDHEITYQSNTDYVFHDSRGFEAGSLDELRLVREFIKIKSQATNLQLQLHAIWYCLPTDDDRPLSESELSFFEQGTYGVPVVAIFTKFDAQRNKAIARLKRDGLSDGEARKQAPSRMQDICPELEKRLIGTNNPPATYLYLQDMHKAAKDCTDLIEKTVSVINNDVLRHLLITVQRNNLSLTIKYCIRDLFKYFEERSSKSVAIIIRSKSLVPTKKELFHQIIRWFPHIQHDPRDYRDEPPYYPSRYPVVGISQI